MRTSICLLLLCISTIGFSGEKQDTLKTRLEPDLSFSLNSNGIAPIPAFSLDKPALIASVNLTKGRFSFDPTLAYSLEGKPWFIDSWFHYNMINRPTFELRTGINFSTFCSGITVNGDEILQAERYFAFSIAGTYKFSTVSTLSLDYWSDNGQESGSLSGHFVALAYERSQIRFGENVQFSANLMLFYINYDGNNDGLFVSPIIACSVRDIPLTLLFQGTQPIHTNISPNPGFKWNVGISVHL